MPRRAGRVGSRPCAVPSVHGSRTGEARQSPADVPLRTWREVNSRIGRSMDHPPKGRCDLCVRFFYRKGAKRHSPAAQDSRGVQKAGGCRAPARAWVPSRRAWAIRPSGDTLPDGLRSQGPACPGEPVPPVCSMALGPTRRGSFTPSGRALCDLPGFDCIRHATRDHVTAFTITAPLLFCVWAQRPGPHVPAPLPRRPPRWRSQAAHCRRTSSCRQISDRGVQNGQGRQQ